MLLKQFLVTCFIFLLAPEEGLSLNRSIGQICLNIFWFYSFVYLFIAVRSVCCFLRWQEEPAVLIFKLLLRMRLIYVASISFGLPQRINGMHIAQFNHARLDLVSLLIWSRVFWLFVTWNLRKAQRWNKSVLTFDRYRPSFVTFGYY